MLGINFCGVQIFMDKRIPRNSQKFIHHENFYAYSKILATYYTVGA